MSTSLCRQDGTTDNTTNLWFCGYTPQLACALWTGYSAGEIPIQKYGTDLLGDSTNLPVFKRFMNTVLTGTEREEFATGTAPTYKNNSVWKFYGTNNTKKSENDDKDKDEEEEETTTTTTTTTTTLSAAGAYFPSALLFSPDNSRNLRYNLQLPDWSDPGSG